MLRRAILMITTLSLIGSSGWTGGLESDTPPPLEQLPGLPAEAMASPPALPPTLGVANVDVAIHVLTRSNGYGARGRIFAEFAIANLNAAYRQTGFTFDLVHFDLIANTNWYDNCNKKSVRNEIAKAHRVNTPQTVNIYICRPRSYKWKFLFGGFPNWEPNGMASYPWSWPEDNKKHLILLRTPRLYVDRSSTLAHEIGHYMGLYHTFERGCTTPGDEVDDTHPEMEYYANKDAWTPACTNAVDTCTADALSDPIHNYMTYRSDGCRTEFTPDQADRMWEQVEQFRPSLVDTLFRLDFDVDPVGAAPAEPSGVDIFVGAKARVRDSVGDLKEKPVEVFKKNSTSGGSIDFKIDRVGYRSMATSGKYKFSWESLVHSSDGYVCARFRVGSFAANYTIARV